MSDSRTPWFGGAIKPVHIGVYERNLPAGIRYSLWDGKEWKLNDTAAKYAAVSKSRSLIQNALWRGLKENPNAK